MIELKCEGCGSITKALRLTEEHFHASCPKRQPRKAIPQFLPAGGRKDIQAVLDHVAKQRDRRK